MERSQECSNSSVVGKEEGCSARDGGQPVGGQMNRLTTAETAEEDMKWCSDGESRMPQNK